MSLKLLPPAILIIDDDEDDVELFKEAVNEVAPTVKCLRKRDGKEGLDFLMNEKNSLPALIFLDLNMPRLNGFQCLREIKKIKALSNIPVIIYTTSRQPEDVSETRRLGAIDFVTKPSHFEDICLVVRDCMQRVGILNNTHPHYP